MTRIATRTGSRLGLQALLTLLLVAVLAIPAMAHDAHMNYGIDAISITSAPRTTLGRAMVKGTVTCSKTTSGVEIYSGVRQVAGLTNTIWGDGWGTIRCVAGKKVPFSVTVTPEQGKFVGAKALVWAYAEKSFYSYNEDTGEEHYYYDFAGAEREMNLTK